MRDLCTMCGETAQAGRTVCFTCAEIHAVPFAARSLPVARGGETVSALWLHEERERARLVWHPVDGAAATTAPTIGLVLLGGVPSFWLLGTPLWAAGASLAVAVLGVAVAAFRAGDREIVLEADTQELRLHATHVPRVEDFVLPLSTVLRVEVRDDVGVTPARHRLVVRTTTGERTELVARLERALDRLREPRGYRG